MLFLKPLKKRNYYKNYIQLCWILFTVCVWFYVVHSLGVFSPLFTVPATSAVQNVLLNPSMIGPKNILITTNMVSSQNTANESNPLKRKHEDDDDSDTI